VTQLAGLRVLEFAQGWLGPLTGRLLSQLGADVVKVEDGTGDWLRGAWPTTATSRSAAFELTSAGKRSALIDHTRDEAAGRRARALMERADVVIVDEAWLDERHSHAGAISDLLARAPTTIVCSVSAFGRDGAWRDWAANDLIVQAVTGVMASTGFDGDPPTRAGPTVADHSTALYAAAAVLAALEDRRHTGRGQLVDIAAYDCLVSYLFLFLSHWFGTGRVPPRQGNRHLTCAPWNAFPCQDGWIQISTSTDTQWRTITQIAGRGELGVDPRFRNTAARMRHIDEVDEVVSAWTRGHPVATILNTLRAVDIPAAHITALDELLRDPQFIAREMLYDTTVVGGPPTVTSGSVFKLSGRGSTANVGTAPDLGAHTHAVLAEYAARPAPRVQRKGPPVAPEGRMALAGLVVVEVGAYGAGPLGTRFLAELGAEVIKIEPLDGDPIRHFLPNIHDVSYPYHFYNLNKRGITLDLKSDYGRGQLRKLLARADVFLENLAPGTIARWGMTPGELMHDFPRLICCSVSGFGHSGPYRNLRAYDTTIQAMSAVMSMTGRAERGPSKVGLSIADLMGPTAACAAILAALNQRHVTGVGQHVDLAMMDVMAWSTQAAWPAYFATGVVPGPMGDAHPSLCPHGTYATKDGRIAVAVERDGQWASLVTILGAAAHLVAKLDTAARIAARGRIDELLSAWAATVTTDEGVTRLQSARVPAGPVLEVAAVADNAQTRRRELVVEVPDAAGHPLRVIQSAFRMSRTPGRMHSGGPLLGQHNDQYLDPPGSDAAGLCGDPEASIHERRV